MYITSDACIDDGLRRTFVLEFGGQVAEQIRRLGVGHALGNRKASIIGVARINKRHSFR